MENVLDMIARTGDGAYAVDRTQRIVMWNEGAEELLGYSRDEAIGKNCWDLLESQDERGRAICRPDCFTLAASVKGESVCSYDAKAYTKDGRQRWVRVSIIPLYDAAEELWAVVHMFHDVHERKQAEIFAQEVRQMAEKIKPGADQESEASQNLTIKKELTPRELEVLGLLVQGADTGTMAEKLMISKATVRNHVQSILHKLGVHSRVEAIAYAHKHNLT